MSNDEKRLSIDEENIFSISKLRFIILRHPQFSTEDKVVVLLRRETSLKVINFMKIVKISNCDFSENCRDYEWAIF